MSTIALPKKNKWAENEARIGRPVKPGTAKEPGYVRNPGKTSKDRWRKGG